MKPLYNRDNYRNFINLIGALALIPIDKVSEGLSIIKHKIPKVIIDNNEEPCTKAVQLLEYFEKHWISSNYCFYILLLNPI